MSFYLCEQFKMDKSIETKGRLVSGCQEWREGGVE
jgi:hypothetical protein